MKKSDTVLIMEALFQLLIGQKLLLNDRGYPHVTLHSEVAEDLNERLMEKTHEMLQKG